MKNNIIKRLTEKVKNKINFNKKYSHESNVCIKVFNVEKGSILSPIKNKNNNRKHNAVDFFDEDKLLAMNKLQRKQYIFENTNKILSSGNVFVD